MSYNQNNQQYNPHQQSFNTQQQFNTQQNQTQQGNLQVCYDPQLSYQNQYQRYNTQQYQGYNTQQHQGYNQQYQGYNQQYQGYNTQQQYQGYNSQQNQQQNTYQQNYQQSYNQPSYNPSIKCTYLTTSKNHVNQFWYQCLDCSPNNESIGCCVVCAMVCHHGHRLSTVKHSNFFCDCGAGAMKNYCQCLKK